MAYSKTTWVNNTSPAINDTNLNKMETGIYDANYMATGRCATLVVAANDSSTLSKQQADYVCDGTADQAQVLAAINALPSGGGKITLLEGIFNFSERISTDVDNVSLQGQGMYETIINANVSYAADGIVFLIEGTDVSLLNRWAISDLQIDLSSVSRGGDSNDRRAVKFKWVKDITMEKVYFKSTPGSAMVADSGANKVLLQYNYLVDVGQGDEFGYGLRVQRSLTSEDKLTNTIINGNVINSVGWNAIAIYGSSKYVTVSNNIINGISVSHSAIALSSGQFVSIVGNIITGVTLAGESGIEIESTTAHASDPEASFYVSVTSNIIENCYIGIDVRRVSGTDTNEDITITGNTIKTTSNNGIKIHTTQKASVVNNVIDSAGAVGIFVDDADFINVSNNVVTESGQHGIGIWGTSSNCMIQENLIVHAGRNTDNVFNTIDIRESASDNFITGNKTIAATSGNVAARALAVATGTCLRNIIENNDFRGTYGNVTLTDWGTDTILYRNHGVT